MDHCNRSKNYDGVPELSGKCYSNIKFNLNVPHPGKP